MGNNGNKSWRETSEPIPKIELTTGLEDAPSTSHPSYHSVLGEVLYCDYYVHQVQWWANGHMFSTDMRVLDLSAFDVILGYDWLRAHSPMLCDWDKKMLEFTHQGAKVKLCGEGAVTPT
jgi:hypothetical protein